MSSSDLLYLDFDGVLHPGPHSWPMSAKKRRSGQYEAGLFCSVHVLSGMLRRYPLDLKIILSTSWVLSHGLDRTRKLLPDEIAQRVIGATFDEKTMDRYEFGELPRHEQILRDVAKRQPARWLAIDDDLQGWPESEIAKLVAPPTELGLQCEQAQAKLKHALASTFSAECDLTAARCNP